MKKFLWFFVCFSVIQAQLLDQCKKKVFSEFCFYSFPDRYLDCLFKAEMGCFMNLCPNFAPCELPKSTTTKFSDLDAFSKSDTQYTTHGLEESTTFFQCNTFAEK